MKVTALLADELIADVKAYTRGKNITDSLHIALTDWVKLQKLKALNAQVAKNPLKFKDGFNGLETRELGRRRRR